MSFRGVFQVVKEVQGSFPGCEGGSEVICRF